MHCWFCRASLMAPLITALFTLSCRSAPDTEDSASSRLVVFHAGSLSVPFRDLSREFRKQYPDTAILAEAAGSRNCARKIVELGRSCDVFGSADHGVIQNLLVPEHADFEIRFATNEMDSPGLLPDTRTCAFR